MRESVSHPLRRESFPPPPRRARRFARRNHRVRRRRPREPLVLFVLSVLCLPTRPAHRLRPLLLNSHLFSCSRPKAVPPARADQYPRRKSGGHWPAWREVRFNSHLLDYHLLSAAGRFTSGFCRPRAERWLRPVLTALKN